MKDVGEILTQFTSRHSIVAFLALFVPGVVALAMHDQRIPSERRKIGEMGVSLVVYSLICDMFGFGFVTFSGFDPLDVTTPHWQLFFFTLVFVLLIPGALGWFIVDLRQWLSEKGLVLDPMPKAWDAYFAAGIGSDAERRTESRWVLGQICVHFDVPVRGGLIYRDAMSIKPIDGCC